MLKYCLLERAACFNNTTAQNKAIRQSAHSTDMARTRTPRIRSAAGFRTIFLIARVVHWIACAQASEERVAPANCYSRTWKPMPVANGVSEWRYVTVDGSAGAMPFQSIFPSYVRHCQRKNKNNTLVTQYINIYIRTGMVSTGQMMKQNKDR